MTSSDTSTGNVGGDVGATLRHATQVVLLGTAGGPRPFVHRGAPAQAILHKGHIYVVDCGNGVARQMVKAGLSLADLRAIFLTHHHGDHMLDIGALPYLAWADGLSSPVDLVGPPPLRKVIDSFLAMIEVDVNARQGTTGRPMFDTLLNVIEVEGSGEVWEADGMRVRTSAVDHPPIRPALAYRFETDERSIVISGDTRYSPDLVELARGADVLVHEAYHGETVDRYTPSVNAQTLREHIVACHTEVHDVGKLACDAGVRLLVLSHLVPADGAIGDNTWLAAAKAHFDGPVVIGRDFQII